MKLGLFAGISCWCVVSNVNSFQIGQGTTNSNIQPLFAAGGGAPQYQKHSAILRKSEQVGKGSYLLHIEYDPDDETAMTLDYRPGNVLALEIQPSSTEQNSDDKHYTMDEKAQKDMTANNGWLRGPYTVSRATPSGFEILIKEVGYKSHIFATAKETTPVQFGGKFKVPIEEGIVNNMNLDGYPQTESVVMVSTGVGVGPCVGAIESMLANDNKNLPSSFQGRVHLLANFRNAEDVAMAKDLDKLAELYPQRFHWKAIITSEMGRISQKQDTLEDYLKLNDGSDNEMCTIHFHLIGNGQVVNEWKAGLQQAGVPTERITFEAYFNHKAESNPTAIQNIANVIKTMSKTAEGAMAR